MGGYADDSNRSLSGSGELGHSYYSLTVPVARNFTQVTVDGIAAPESSVKTLSGWSQ